MAPSIWDKITEYRLQPKPKTLHGVTVFVHIFLLLLAGPLTYTLTLFLVVVKTKHIYVWIGIPAFLFLCYLGVHVWLSTLFIAPLLAVGLSLWDKLRFWFMPRTIQDLQKEQDAKFQAKTTTASSMAKAQPTRAPEFIDLGVVIDSDSFPKYTGVTRVGGWLRMPIHRLLLQSLVIGKTGSGKTELLKRIIYETIADPDWNVVVVDAKGDKNFAKQVVAMAPPAPILKLGWGEIGSVFNGFEGDAQAIYNRLVMMFGLAPMGGDSDYYKTRKRMILQLICGLNAQARYPIDPFEPPRSFQELEKRVAYDWLADTYRNTDAVSSIEDIKGDLPTFKAEIISASTPLLNILHPKGFKLGDYKLSFFSVDAGSIPFDAGYFFRFFAGCVSHYLSTSSTKTLFVFDEPALLGVENLVGLINTGRSKGGAVILATQNLGTLGPKWHIVDQIFDGVNLRILMKSEATDDLLERFGRHSVSDTSIQIKDGAVSGTTTRMKDVFKLDARRLRQLHDGLCIVDLDGYTATIQSVMAPQTLYTDDMEAIEVREDRVIEKPAKPKPRKTKAPVPD